LSHGNIVGVSIKRNPDGTLVHLLLELRGERPFFLLESQGAQSMMLIRTAPWHAHMLCVRHL
jgi:hypothetical protein